jgi:hypothetical protein
MDKTGDIPTQLKEAFGILISNDTAAISRVVGRIFDEDCKLTNPYLVGLLQIRSALPSFRF